MSNKNNQELRLALAQKLMLDIRYFCTDGKQGYECQSPVTSLPNELIPLVSEHKIGGLILFAENLDSAYQILDLNYQLQHQAAKANIPPLFISIDQEGGRVVRLPASYATSFAGNMAIGASYSEHKTHFADISGKGIGEDLKHLGFNLNFAPTIDVNVNPLNPVINVRAYGEHPDWVAQLGLAQMSKMQEAGIIPALKHFPGHGDTHVDSHTGLPTVDHDKETIKNIDLAPFQYAINKGNVDMIMTAHIQYPNLDDSQFIDKQGSASVVPATMSKKILQDLLRDEMGFSGVIITDALNMAGIAQFYEQTEAVISTFQAGSDIALMPLIVRSPKDIKQVGKLLDELVDAVNQGKLDQSSILESSARIQALKNKYQIGQWANTPKTRFN